ncbi:MAG: NnrU family protein, partial [Paracoccaceae bacterium]
MIWIVAGVLLWSAAHGFKRLAPGPRASLGNVGKALVAIANVGAITLMVIGYKAADVVELWELGGWSFRLRR